MPRNRYRSCKPLISELTRLGQELIQSCIVKVLRSDDGRHQQDLGFSALTGIDVIQGLIGEDRHDHSLRELRINLVRDFGGTRAYIADELDDLLLAHVRGEAAPGSDHEGCRDERSVTCPLRGLVKEI